MLVERKKLVIALNTPDAGKLTAVMLTRVHAV